MSIGSLPKRVPFIWILGPLVTGIAIAHLFETSVHPLVTICLATLLSISALVLSNRNAPLLISLIGSSALLSGMALLTATVPPNTKPSYYVPREIDVGIRISKTFNLDNPDKSSGIGVIIETPVHLRYLLGQHISFSARNQGFHPQEGETYQIRGLLNYLGDSDDNAGFEQYLKSQLVAAKLNQGIIVERTEQASPLLRFVALTKSWISTTLHRNELPESEYSAAYQGLLLGEKHQLSSEQKQLFLQNGTMHLFAISGLHIGIIALCIHNVLLLLRCPFRLVPIGTLAVVLLFVLVTGGSASSWRAFIMLACFFACRIFRRQTSPFNALALSAVVYLAVFPHHLFQAGFQMSYLTVSTILLLGVPLGRNLNKAFPSFPNVPHSVRSPWKKAFAFSKTWLLNGFSVSAAAYLPSLFLGALYFQIVPVYGIPINIFALPFATLALMAGVASLFSGLLALSFLSELFNNAALVLIAAIHHFLRWLNWLPFSSIAIPSVSSIATTLAIIAVLLLCMFAYVKQNAKTALLWQSSAFLFGVFEAWLLFR